MLKYILKRLFASLITIWVIVTVTFFLMHAIPGGPFTSDKKLPVAIQASLEKKWGLDKPLSAQYVAYLTSLSHGDLGPSITYQGKSVNDVIGYSFPTSAKLGAAAIIYALVLGLFMGIVSALNQGKWPDQISMLIATLGVCIPSFVVATLLIYVFAVWLQVLPAIGFDGPLNYIMPVIALGGFPMAFIARLSRSSLLDVVRQDYIRTAKAKGLSRNTVIFKHALRNALIPVVTYLGPLVAGILTGSFVVETIFGIPGLGREFVTSISNRDYSIIMGVTVFFGLLIIACNLFVDILYVVIDPRIKLES